MNYFAREAPIVEVGAMIADIDLSDEDKYPRHAYDVAAVFEVKDNPSAFLLVTNCGAKGYKDNRQNWPNKGATRQYLIEKGYQSVAWRRLIAKCEKKGWRP